MNIIILKTNLGTPLKVASAGRALAHQPFIKDWSVDLEDIDNVLRVEAEDQLHETDVMALLQQCGAIGEPLTD